MYFIDSKLENYLFWIVKLAMLNYSLYRFNVLLIIKALNKCRRIYKYIKSLLITSFYKHMFCVWLLLTGYVKNLKKAGPSL